MALSRAGAGGRGRCHTHRGHHAAERLAGLVWAFNALRRQVLHHFHAPPEDSRIFCRRTWAHPRPCGLLGRGIFPRPQRYPVCLVLLQLLLRKQRARLLCKLAAYAIVLGGGRVLAPSQLRLWLERAGGGDRRAKCGDGLRRGAGQAV